MGVFQVETDRNRFEPVHATGLTIMTNGILFFEDDDGEMVIAYAPDAWRTVHPDEED